MAFSALGRGPTVIFLNCRGLNTPEKRTSLLRELKKRNPQVSFLQETHFRTSQIPNLTNTFFPTAFHATAPTSKTKRVFILMHKETPFELHQQLSDPEGRYLFLKGILAGRPITFANVYFPISSQITFCRHIVDELK